MSHGFSVGSLDITVNMAAAGHRSAPAIGAYLRGHGALRRLRCVTVPAPVYRRALGHSPAAAPGPLRGHTCGWAPRPAAQAFAHALPHVAAAPRRRFASSSSLAERNQQMAMYMLAVALGTLGAAYASVPLYKVFCQATGFGGTTQRVDGERARDLTPAEDGRVLKITFSADTSDEMPWKFRPQQRDVKVVPGETALAFFRAENPTDKAITGVATYNVFPPKVRRPCRRRRRGDPDAPPTHPPPPTHTPLKRERRPGCISTRYSASASRSSG